MKIPVKAVGRISERLAMNELEARGYQIIDLAYMSKTSANVDFIASKHGRSFNVQVKGSAYHAGHRPTIQYGYCDQSDIDGETKMFNSTSDAALHADIVVLVAITAPKIYRCFVLPIDDAEKAAQMNLDRYYRQLKKSGDPRKPGKVWIEIESLPKQTEAEKGKFAERNFVLGFEDRWELIEVTES